MKTGLSPMVATPLYIFSSNITTFSEPGSVGGGAYLLGYLKFPTIYISAHFVNDGNSIPFCCLSCFIFK